MQFRDDLLVEKLSSKKNPNLINEEKQLSFFLKDMLEKKNDELKKTQSELNVTRQVQNQTNSKLFDIQQQNEFLKDIRLHLNSKVKTLELLSSKKIQKAIKNIPKTNTDRKFSDQQMPLLSITRSINSSNVLLNESFDKIWLENFKKIEDCILLAKLQIEEIVDYTEKESLS